MTLRVVSGLSKCDANTCCDDRLLRERIVSVNVDKQQQETHTGVETGGVLSVHGEAVECDGRICGRVRESVWFDIPRRFLDLESAIESENRQTLAHFGTVGYSASRKDLIVIIVGDGQFLRHKVHRNVDRTQRDVLIDAMTHSETDETHLPDGVAVTRWRNCCRRNKSSDHFKAERQANRGLRDDERHTFQVKSLRGCENGLAPKRHK